MDRENTSILLRQARGGSLEALGQVIQLVGDRLLAYIRLRLHGPLRAQVESRDILQATLLHAFERFDQFEGSGRDTLMGWMAAIAKHEILGAAEFHGRQKRDVGKQISLAELGSSQEVVAEVRNEVNRIALKRDLESLGSALGQLADDHREVILLRKFEELGFAEIGERLGRSPDACRMLLARAMTALSGKMYELRGQAGGR